MGGGDLNMKKSWHPLLLKNQERVWLEEKKALEEKKKLDQLRKEKEEERQLQELQRLQEEQTGKKRTEKLEWMYATPATGSSQNPNDLEDYLLGKKRVDKILTADENAKLGASHKNFIAVQNANNARDIAAKIREDPLLAIKQQEQAAYQALLSNPLRLREMQLRNGIMPKKEKVEKKRDKEERRREKEERKRLKHERKRRERDRASYSRSRSRSGSPQRAVNYRHSAPNRRLPVRSHSADSRRSYSPESRRSRYENGRGYNNGRSPQRDERRQSPEGHRRHDTDRHHESRLRTNDRGHSQMNGYHNSHHDTRGRSSSPGRSINAKRLHSPRFDSDRSPAYKRKRLDDRPASPPRSAPTKTVKADEERAARLAAMSSNAQSMSVERQQRLAELLEREKAELQAEEEARAKSKGMGGFIGQEQKRVFGGIGGLEDRIRRGRGGMVVDAD